MWTVRGFRLIMTAAWWLRCWLRGTFTRQNAKSAFVFPHVALLAVAPGSAHLSTRSLRFQIFAGSRTFIAAQSELGIGIEAHWTGGDDK